MSKHLVKLLAVVFSVLICSCSEKEPLPVSVSSITLNPTSVSLVEGETTTVSATISPSNADNQKVIWSSDNSSVATVNNGTITAISEGTATITAKSDDGGKTATCSVSVKSKLVPVESVSLDKTAITLRVGGTAEVKATISPDNATNKTIDWKSSDESIASVKGGIITGVGLGTCSITATVDGKTATCTIIVEATPVESITLSVDKAEVMEGKTMQLSATVLPEDATDKTVVWSSSDEAVAKVSGDGLVSAISAGQATITATSGDKSASCLISVSPAPIPLTFTAVGNSTIALKSKGTLWPVQFNYRKGAGEWTPYEVGQTIQLSDGESISFRIVGKGSLTYGTSGYHYFVMAGQLSASGNISSLLNEDMQIDSYVDFHNLFDGCSSLLTAPELPAVELSIAKCYYEMFRGCTSLVDAPALPATTLSPGCYERMFEDCKSLVNAPALPATTLADECYRNMFSGCNSLVDAPELPASTMVKSCYSSMFSSCNSLLNAPELPATTLAENCYGSMFYNCNNLVKAPALPVTTLADACYSGMFRGCTSLVDAPELPATTLAELCYSYMFEDCTSLMNAPALPATSLDVQCYYRMFRNCRSLVEVPKVLPATLLYKECYRSMFEMCSSLVNAPELPATILSPGCYDTMFLECSSLVNAPELPATDLAPRCYYSMFYNCRSLANIKALFTQVQDPYMIKDWLSRVSAKGTFVRNPEATWTRDEVHIPSGWTIVDAE